jgi:CubicO group peptidase (beta-lactamase class C family)
MVDTGFGVPPGQHGRMAAVHQRVDGRLREIANPPSLAVPPRGDGALYSTSSDYVRFIQLVLNGGRVRGTRLLSEAAIAAMSTNQIGTIRVRRQPATDSARARPFPTGAGHDTWSYGFQIASGNGTAPGLRSPGSLGWGGLYNTHFFIDLSIGIGVVVMMQLLPFYDEAAMRVLHRFERAVYEALL